MRLQDGKPAEVPGAWLVQRAAKSQTVPEARPPAPPSTAAALGLMNQNSSLESLTDQGVLPAPGEKVRYKQSELMRLTAHRLASAAAASLQSGHTLAVGTGAETAPMHGPAVVQLSSLFLNGPTPVPLQAATRSAGDDGGATVAYGGPGSSAPTALGTEATAGGVAGCGPAASQDTTPLGPTDMESASADEYVDPEEVGIPARAFSAPPESSTTGESPLHDESVDSADNAVGAEVVDPGELGECRPDEDETLLHGSSFDSGSAGVSEFGSAGSSGGWKVPDGAIVHKRRSSRTVPGLLQTIAEADQEESA